MCPKVSVPVTGLGGMSFRGVPCILGRAAFPKSDLAIWEGRAERVIETMLNTKGEDSGAYDNLLADLAAVSEQMHARFTDVLDIRQQNDLRDESAVQFFDVYDRVVSLIDTIEIGNDHG